MESRVKRNGRNYTRVVITSGSSAVCCKNSGFIPLNASGEVTVHPRGSSPVTLYVNQGTIYPIDVQDIEVVGGGPTQFGIIDSIDDPDGGFPEPWTPADITTIAWYNPSNTGTITESGGDVSQLDDIGTDADKHLTSPASNELQTGTTTINGKNTLYADGSAAYMISPALGDYTVGDICVFMVAQVDNVTIDRFDPLWSIDGSTSDFLHNWRANQSSGSTFEGCIQTPAFVSPNNPESTLGVNIGPSIYNVNFDWTNGPHFNAFIDGTQAIANEAWLAKATSSYVFKIATNDNNSRYIPAQFGEIVIVESATLDIRQRIEGYLAHEWGLTGNLPVGHPYKSQQPTT